MVTKLKKNINQSSINKEKMICKSINPYLRSWKNTFACPENSWVSIKFNLSKNFCYYSEIISWKADKSIWNNTASTRLCFLYSWFFRTFFWNYWIFGPLLEHVEVFVLYCQIISRLEIEIFSRILVKTAEPINC